MTRSLLLFIFLLSSFPTLFAQQLPLFSLYRENQVIVNPAAMNMDFLIYEYNLSAGISYRNQWTGATSQLGLNIGPNTRTGRVELVLPRQNVYTGLNIIQDVAGPVNTTGAYLRGGYVISPDVAYGGISLGLSFGVLNYRIDFSKAEEFLTNLQNPLDFTPINKTFYDAALGLYLYRRLEKGPLEGDWFYAGLSMPQLFELDLTSALDRASSQGGLQLNPILKVYGVAGLFKYLNSDSFIESTLWLRYIDDGLNGMNIDFNLRYQVSNIFWLGTGLGIPVRLDGNRNIHEVFQDVVPLFTPELNLNEMALLFEAGFYIGENVGLEGNNLKVGFGYGFILGNYDNPFRSTYEINVTYTRDTDSSRH